MASGGHFHYRFIRGRALPGTLPVKSRPEATFTIELFVDGPSLATSWDMASGSHFHYRFIRGRALPEPAAGKWPPEATFAIDLFVDGPSLGHLL